MKDKYMLKINNIYLDDCLNIMQKIDNESIDHIITDPPYGYNFMGKDWDKAFVDIKIWKECFRILKPGSWCLVMSSPRQDVLSKMIVNLSDSGFKTNFTSLYWIYATGFPKSYNICNGINKKVKAKAIYSKLNKDDLYGTFSGYNPKPSIEIIIICMKPLSEKTYLDQAIKNKKGITYIENCRIPYKNDKDKKNACSLRQNYKNHKEDRYVFSEMNKNKSDKRGNNDGRFPANVICSSLIDVDAFLLIEIRDKLNNNQKHCECVEYICDYFGIEIYNLKNMSNKEIEYLIYNFSNILGCSSHDKYFSKYFDLDAWIKENCFNKKDMFNCNYRDQQDVFPCLIVPKPTKSEKNMHCDILIEKERKTMNSGIKEIRGNKTGHCNKKYIKSGINKMKNIHPTVKPIKLMKYLITLISREEDIILDPFCGSGTTCISCIDLNRKYIGIEKDSEYFNIAKHRIINKLKQ